MKKSCSTRITAHKTVINCATGQTGWLMQWHYTQRGVNKWGEYSSSHFRSIIKRDGESRLYLDSPYYCYAGKHRYRKLPRRLAVRVAACVVRGYVHDKIYRMKERSRFAWWRMQQYINTKVDRFKHREERRAFDAFLKGM